MTPPDPPQAHAPNAAPEPPLNSQLTTLSTAASRRTKSIGKISRLPRAIREQLNRRLQNEEEAKPILEWVNALPEVQSLLAAEFQGRPISKQNLSEWKQNGFRDWQISQSDIEFAQNLAADQAELDQLLPGWCAAGTPALPSRVAGALTHSLAQWVALRYAAVAQSLSTMDDDPDTELRRLRDFCRDIVSLRRGDLSAGRLSIEQARLTLEQADTDAEKEKEFWAWARRPEVQARLYPKRDPDQIRREVVRMVDRELLGIRHPVEEQDAPTDPAVLI